MRYKHKPGLVTIISISIAMAFTACEREQDVAPYATYPGKANCTIEQLLSYHDIGSTDSYDTIPAGTVISGIVTSSDEHGNCYKYINIEDSTGAIQIKVNSSALYHKFAVGQRVFVECDGLVIGDYRKLPQMGLWANGKIEYIPFNRLTNYIHCDGLPVKVEPTITLTSVTSADELPATFYNRLVRIEGAKFADGGNATFSESTANTSRDMELEGGGTVVLRTSNYADFAGRLLPEGTGTVVGLLSRYNNYIQLVIRSIDDLQDFKVPVYEVDFGAGPFECGWEKVTSGDEWEIRSFGGVDYFSIRGTTATDSWLISPEIDLSDKNSPTLSFSHRAPGGNAGTMKCYYTTAYTGDVNTTLWNEIPINAFGSNSNEVSCPIPEEAQGSGFRFAYRYNGSGSQWFINDISISAFIN